MADRKLSSTIRTASAVNLRYSADLLNLGRDYIKAFSAALLEPGQEPSDKDAPVAARAPLLLAGHAGETANAAFSLKGNSNLVGTVALEVTGDFGDSKVTLQPSSIEFDGETEQIVRILAKIGRKMPPETDHVGTVTIKQPNHLVTNFVLRKLPK